MSIVRLVLPLCNAATRAVRGGGRVETGEGAALPTRLGARTRTRCPSAAQNAYDPRLKVLLHGGTLKGGALRNERLFLPPSFPLCASAPATSHSSRNSLHRTGTGTWVHLIDAGEGEKAGMLGGGGGGGVESPWRRQKLDSALPNPTSSPF